MTAPTSNEALIDPLLVRTFLAVAEAGSISAGARRVFRTQSTASTQIQNLEEQLGARLFERDTRTLALTAEGERFRQHAERLLAVNREALRSLRPERAQPVLRIGFSEYFEPERLAQSMRRLHREWPDYLFELRIAQSRVLEQEFEAKRLDLAVVSKLSRARSARSEELCWVSVPGLLLPASAALPLVLLPRDCSLHALAIETLERAKLAHRLAVVCSGTAGIHAALRAGLGLGCLNSGAVPHDLEPRRERRLPSLPSLRFEWRTRSGTLAPSVAELLAAATLKSPEH
jgi:DNA-binding transcriptional LysR family regulator